MKQFDWKTVSSDLLASFGGKDNIKSFMHCATRLRVYVKDDKKVQKANLLQVDLVKGVNKDGDQWQIIFGAGVVNKAHDHFKTLIIKNSDQSIKKATNTTTKTMWWNPQFSWHSNLFSLLRKLVRDFAEIFIPLIPIFIAGGLALAFNSLTGTIARALGTENTISTKNALFFFEMIGGAILGGLPAFVGYTAMKKFGGSPLIGLAIGLIMIFPGLVNGWSSGSSNNALSVPLGGDEAILSFYLKSINIEPTKEILAQYSVQGNAIFGTIFKGEVQQISYVGSLFPSAPKFFAFDLVGYQAQVFPVILIVALGYGIEKLFLKFTPEFLAIILVPLATIFLSVFFGFWFIGPVGRFLAMGLGWTFNNLFTYTNFAGFGFGGMLLGFAYPFLVITGLHQGLLPIEANMIASTKLEYGHSFTWITPIATVSNIAQAMAGLAIAILLTMRKNNIGAAKAYSGALSANLGITEPILFGVNLPVKFPIYAAALGSALGGYWVGATHTVANSVGSASWLGLVFQFDYEVLPQFDNYLTGNNISAMLTNIPPIANMAIAAMIASIGAIGFTFLFAKLKFGKKSLDDFALLNKAKVKKVLVEIKN